MTTGKECNKKEVREWVSTFKPKSLKNTRLTKDEQQSAEIAQEAAESLLVALRTKVTGCHASIITDEGKEYPVS